MLREWQQRRRFERLVRPQLEALRRFAFRLESSPSEAEDLLQEALLQGMTHIDQLQSDGAMRVWMSRVVYRTFLNRCRKRRADRTEEWSERADQTVIPFPSPAEQVSCQRLGLRLEAALQRLPDAQREAVWLVDGQGFKFHEAAEILGVPPGTVASRVARGRTTLRMDLVDIAREEGVIR